MGEIIDMNKEQFEMIKSVGNFDIQPCSESFMHEQGVVKLDTNNTVTKQLSSFAHYIPSIMATNALAQSYSVSFPDGLPHVLTALKQGGYGTMIKGENGRFVGTASLYSNTTQALAYSMFNAMSIASGQYFLSQINNELKIMKLNIDKILEFLYGDKKAELMSEVSFVKYAYQNFSYIMESNEQRIATIGSLQSSKKVAMKDIEFYMSDLDSTINGKNIADISTLTDKAFQIKESLELSIQLYGMSSVLETYFANNHEAAYLKYIENEMTSYIDKCEKRMLSSFSILGKRICDYKGKFWEKNDPSLYGKTVNELVDSLNSGEESKLRRTFREALSATNKVTKCYVTNDGIIYLKTS